MASFLMKQMMGDKLSKMTGGGADESAGTEGASPAAKAGMSREEFEALQQQQMEEKMERDKEFGIKKAERANLRVILRDKYRLPENADDEATVNMAGDDIDVPEDLLKMVDEDIQDEVKNESLLVNIQNMDVDAIKSKLTNMDVDEMKNKAQTTMTGVKTAAEEKCSVM